MGIAVFSAVIQQSCKSSACKGVVPLETAHVETAPVQTSTGVSSLDQFLTDFETAVQQQSTSTILNFLDKDYKKEQYEKQMKSNTDSFLNRFFSNNQMKANAYTIVFRNITKITRLDAKMVGAYYIVNYKIETKDASILLPLTVFTRMEGTVIKYALYGPVGS